jgi:Fic family protein
MAWCARDCRAYSISAQLYRVRDDYYAALEQASGNALDATAWLQFFANQIEAAAKASEHEIRNVLDKADDTWRENNERSSTQDCTPAARQKSRWIRRRDDKRQVRKFDEQQPGASAQRDLANLVAAGVLTLTGSGRGARYEIRWD